MLDDVVEIAADAFEGPPVADVDDGVDEGDETEATASGWVAAAREMMGLSGAVESKEKSTAGGVEEGPFDCMENDLATAHR